ncbi:MAG: adenylosuccinate synthetase [Luteolibacter sp.]
MVKMTRYASVLGLGFGDCGKGLFVDALTRRWHAHTVVRFNGGAQAGHNVVTSSNAGSAARHHTFSQFGSGTLVPGVCTVLLDPVVLHPTALLVESEVLGRNFIHDALSRIKIDAQCRLTTPYHQAAGRLREILRSNEAHGTCGVGVGETVRHSIAHPGQVLRYGDFAQADAVNVRAQMDKLQAIRETLLAEFFPLCPAGSDGAFSEEFQTLRNDSLAGKWLNHCRALARQCPPASSDALHDQLTQAGCVLFEGAQGVLLDEWRGFHPHTTWSSINTAAVDDVAARFGIAAPIEHHGVLRSYLTRHGAGPLPTHDGSLDAGLPEPHNQGDGWQGGFRRGHPDAVLLRYAIEAAGELTGLLVSHLDVFERGVKLKWCESYSAGASSCVERLPLGNHKDLDHQNRLTNLLLSAQPRYSLEPVSSAQSFLERITSVTPLPVVMGSFGNTFDSVRELTPSIR